MGIESLLEINFLYALVTGFQVRRRGAPEYTVGVDSDDNDVTLLNKSCCIFKIIL